MNDPSTDGAEAGTPPAALVDARGRRCPIPVIELARRIRDVAVGELIELWADDPAAAADVAAWCRMRGHTLVAAEPAAIAPPPPSGVPAPGGRTPGAAAPEARSGDRYLVRRLS